MRIVFRLTAALLGTAACGSSNVTEPENALPAVVSVAPAGQAVGVDPAATITIQFSHAMMAGMERYVALHEGGTVAGPQVPGTWTWSSDHAVLMFVPDAPLRHAAQYTIHIGGGMRDRLNRELDHGACAAQGGVNAPAGMMGGGDMMGAGWRHSNGSFGMLFTFTTA